MNDDSCPLFDEPRVPATKNTVPHPRVDVHIRWLTRRDMPEILRIERQCFKEFPWSEDQLIRQLRQRNCIGMAAESLKRGDVLGYMIYELQKSRLELLNFAVLPGAWRFQVGTQMLDKLKSKLHRERRHTLGTMVRETNLAAQQFFRANGLRAVEVRRRFYDTGSSRGDASSSRGDASDESAYQFVYQLPELVEGIRAMVIGGRGASDS